MFCQRRCQLTRENKGEDRKYFRIVEVSLIKSVSVKSVDFGGHFSVLVKESSTISFVIWQRDEVEMLIIILGCVFFAKLPQKPAGVKSVDLGGHSSILMKEITVISLIIFHEEQVEMLNITLVRTVLHWWHKKKEETARGWYIFWASIYASCIIRLNPPLCIILLRKKNYSSEKIL